ncbi:MAG TPA: hypothetical protein VL122_06880 [Nitrospirota bacterium]|nr:hypothetical protein [Nitrospirota bacterium]
MSRMLAISEVIKSLALAYQELTHIRDHGDLPKDILALVTTALESVEEVAKYYEKIGPFEGDGGKS